MEQTNTSMEQMPSGQMPSRMKIAPDTLAYASDEQNQLTVEFEIPGAPGDSIDLKILEDSLYLTAPAGNIEYVTALSFCCPVKPGQAKAEYNNGLLKIQVPFKDPMEDAVKVPITAAMSAPALGQGQRPQGKAKAA